MGEVRVSTSSVRREWRRSEATEMVLAFVSKDPFESIEAVLEPAADQVAREVGEAVALSAPMPTPKGVVFWVDRTDTWYAVVRMLEILSDAARSGGLSGVFRPAPDDRSLYEGRIVHELVALVTLHSSGPSNQPRDRVLDPGVAEHVRDWALRWCQVPGGRWWVSPDIAEFEVTAESLPSILTRTWPKPQFPLSRLSAGVGRRLPISDWYDGTFSVLELGRLVQFPHHFLIVSVGSTESLDWREALVDLTQVLRDLSPVASYGAIRLGGDTPFRDAEFLDPFRTKTGIARPRAELNAQEQTAVVSRAFGVQLLGPEHCPLPTDPRWLVEDLGSAMTLLTDRALAPWFEQQPSDAFLDEAERSLGELFRPPSPVS